MEKGYEVHAGRRTRLIDSLPDRLILVRGSSGDGAINHNFFYLTGLHEPSAALLMSSNGIRIYHGRKYPGPDYVSGKMANQILFLPAGDPLLARWGEDSAATLGSVSAEEIGVDAVFGSGDLQELLSSALMESAALGYVRSVPPALGGGLDGDSAFVDDLRKRFFSIDVTDETAAVEEMRRIKDRSEIEAIRHAIDVTHQAIDAAWKTARPGMYEYELEAEINRCYRSHGGGHAFNPIVASGKAACSLHYERNDRKIEAGSLVLVDTGASVHGYNGDITRTFPVDGKFTSRQKEIYEVVLKALEFANGMAAPGTNLAEIHARTFEVIDGAGYGEYFVHGTSHFLGIETHDVGNRYSDLEPGAVFTVEPGVYIPDEGIGVRIEDVVAVTDNGCEVLSDGIPKAVDDIEKILADR